MFIPTCQVGNMSLERVYSCNFFFSFAASTSYRCEQHCHVDTLSSLTFFFSSLYGRNNNNKKSDGNPTLSSPIKKSEVKERAKKRLNPVGFFRFGS